MPKLHQFSFRMLIADVICATSRHVFVLRTRAHPKNSYNFTARRYDSEVYAVIVCLSVCSSVTVSMLC